MATRPLSRRELLRHGLGVAGAAAAAPFGGRILGDLLLGDRASAAEAYGETAGAGDVQATGVSIVPPRIITRQEWGADESLRSGTPEYAPIMKMVVHHTATPNNPPDPAAVVRAILRDHTQGNGWNDIGYNFLIDAEGRVYEGRWARDYTAGEVHSGESGGGQGVVGAHAAGFNIGSVGIALLGTFTSGVPSEATVASLVRLLAWKMGPREIDPSGSSVYTQSSGATRAFSNIAGHRDLAATACPGSSFHPMLAEVRARTAARLRSGLVGYRALASDGSVKSLGDVGDLGDLPRLGISTSTRSIASTRSGNGYWILGTDGGVFSFGDARFHGSLPGLRIRNTAIDLAPTSSDNGYWVLGADGGIFSFGDAPFFGSVPGVGIRTTVLKMARTPSGNGYWILGADGGVFSFGDAQFHGSLPGLRIRNTVVDLASTPSGGGYWVLGADGGVFSFGDAPFFGSIPGLGVRWTGPARAIVPTPTGEGYLVLASDGGVFAFGDAPFLGSATSLRKLIVDLTPVIQYS